MAEELVQRLGQVTKLVSTATTPNTVASLTSAGDIEVTLGTGGIILTDSVTGVRRRGRFVNGDLTWTDL